MSEDNEFYYANVTYEVNRWCLNIHSKIDPICFRQFFINDILDNNLENLRINTLLDHARRLAQTVVDDLLTDATGAAYDLIKEIEELEAQK